MTSPTLCGHKDLGLTMKQLLFVSFTATANTKGKNPNYT
jgi:hypothetical protein